MADDDVPLNTVADLLSALPKRLRLGSQTYRIKIVSFPTEKRVWGEFDSDEHLIKLSPAMPTRERLVETVLHELLHGVWATRNIADETKEESAVSDLAPGLLCLFRDNPRFLSWLRRAIR